MFSRVLTIALWLSTVSAALLLLSFKFDDPARILNTIEEAASPVMSSFLSKNIFTGYPWWRQDALPWSKVPQYHVPKLKEKPLTPFNLTLALLRTVQSNEAVFWCRNPWGPMQVVIKGGTMVINMTSPVPMWDTDFTEVLRINNLAPYTKYRYMVLLSLNGSWHENLNGTFTTFLAKDQLIPPSDPLLLSFGSCLRPMGGGHSGQSIRLLSKWSPAPKMMFFVGDFIYFWDNLPHVAPEYLSFYHRALGTHEVQEAMRAMPWFVQFDDHEINNDYAGEGDPTKNAWHAPAMKAWDAMMGRANPITVLPPPGPEKPFEREQARWYTVSYGNAHFFVLDTRSFKVNSPELDGPLLGQLQLAELHRWLNTTCRRSRLAWCFLVSPVIFSHGSYREDLWYGNMKEQAQVLEWMKEPGTSPVTILSGDSHIAAMWEVAMPDIVEFTCSPVDAFSLFYPWKMPPRFSRPSKRRKKKRHRVDSKPWPVLGDLPPPRTIFRADRGHLTPAGFNCLVQVNATTLANSTTKVELRMDIVDGHKEELLHSYTQFYTA